MSHVLLQTPTFLNMLYKDSPYFTLKPYGGKFLSRLAPGMSVTLIVTFTPQQYEDYIHKVTFYTEKHEYAVPLIGKFKALHKMINEVAKFNVNNRLITTNHKVCIYLIKYLIYFFYLIYFIFLFIVFKAFLI